MTHELQSEVAALKAKLAEAEARCEDADLLLGNGWEQVVEIARGEPGVTTALRTQCTKLAGDVADAEAQRDAAVKDRKKVEENWRRAYEEDTAVLNRGRQELHLHRYMAEGNYWAWQGDGHDFPESLVCPVLMSAEQVRTLLAQQDAATAEASRLRAACETFREAVLNDRHQLAELTDQDPDVTNAVLGLFDDTIGAALRPAAAPGGPTDG